MVDVPSFDRSSLDWPSVSLLSLGSIPVVSVVCGSSSFEYGTANAPKDLRLRADYDFVSSDLLDAADDFDVAEFIVVIKPVQINTYDFQNRTGERLTPRVRQPETG